MRDRKSHAPLRADPSSWCSASLQTNPQVAHRHTCPVGSIGLRLASQTRIIGATIQYAISRWRRSLRCIMHPLGN